MNGTDIVGYLFAEEPFCESCIHDLFIPFDLIGGPDRTTEDILDLVASERGIQRHNESSFSTYRFPKPIYLADVSGDVCVFCGKHLGDQQSASP
jgi:hypothetical protein